MVTTMNTTREYVSMLMDSNQINDEMLDRLLSEDAAAEAWYEYHLLGDCMRYKAGAGRDADFMQAQHLPLRLPKSVKNTSNVMKPKLPLCCLLRTFKLRTTRSSIILPLPPAWLPLPLPYGNSVRK